MILVGAEAGKNIKNAIGLINRDLMDNQLDNPKPTPESVVLQEDTDSTPSEAKPLHRGLWADVIKDGDQIPVGGSIFSDNLDIILNVDTDWLNGKIENFTKERVDEAFRGENGEKFKKWIEDSGTKIDAETLHALFQVLMKMRALLQVNDDTDAMKRTEIYISKAGTKLSEMVGQSMCAEQAIVGKLLLDRIGIKSVLMEGVHVDAKDQEPGDHAFLILDDSQGEGSLIFDIARPKASLNGYPRILRSNRKIDYSVFEGKNNYVIPATDVYNGQTLYYGVGNPSLMQDINFAD